MKMKVLVIREDGRFSETLRERGFEAVNLPLIRTEPANDLTGLEEKLDRVNEYDGLIFTSSAAAEVFLGRLGTERSFGGKVYVLGNRTAACFDGTGLRVVTAEEANTAEELIEALGKDEFLGKKLLFVRGEKSLRTIPEMLADAAEVDEAVVYKTVNLRPDPETKNIIENEIESEEISWACFFSPSGVGAFNEIFGPVPSLRIAVIGTTTAAAAKKAGMTPEYISPGSSAAKYAAGLAEYIKNCE